jgi:hypothetical protein
MPNKHSPLARQKRLARRIILDSAYYDRQNCESVSMLSRVNVLTLMAATVEQSSGSAFILSDEPIYVGSVPDVSRGEVLTDTRGQGSFQR